MLRYGVNYVPPKDWFYSWQDIDLAAVDEDFHAIRELGFDHMRLHLRWDLFQPNAAFVSKKLLNDLSCMLDKAYKYGLDVQIAALDGWMSGFWFLPNFIGNRNIVTDEDVIRAEEYFLAELARAVGSHPALMGIDIGNEINMFATRLPFTTEEGDRWLRRIFALLDELFPGKNNVVGVDHQPWFSDVQFSRRTLAETGGMTSLHTWIGFTGALGYGIDSEECLALQAFNIELADAYATDPGRKVWVQEFGITDEWTEPENFERYIRRSMMAAARCDSLWGFTWWCSHDIDKRLREFQPLEYGLGLLDGNNRPKPLADYIGKCIEDMKRGEKLPDLKKGAAIVIDESEPFSGWKYGTAYADLVRQGEHGRFVLSSRADDKAYLSSRGIDRLIRLKSNP